MAVNLIAGRRYDGVVFGTAPGTDPGYVLTESCAKRLSFLAL